MWKRPLNIPNMWYCDNPATNYIIPVIYLMLILNLFLLITQ
nr:MAG TPA: hypothetical protein [Caudoviricetes sp.]